MKGGVAARAVSGAAPLTGIVVNGVT